MKITREFLVNKSAHEGLLNWFDGNFPKGGECQEVLDTLAADPAGYAGWAAWLLGQAGKTDEVRVIDGDLIARNIYSWIAVCLWPR